MNCKKCGAQLVERWGYWYCPKCETRYKVILAEIAEPIGTDSYGNTKNRHK